MRRVLVTGSAYQWRTDPVPRPSRPASPRARREGYVVLLWIGSALFVTGRLVDLVWHATHEGFESAADQVQAHLVVWIGTVLLLIAAVRAIAARTRNAGYRLLLFATVVDVGVSAWHFWEHSRHRDPDLPHLLLVAADIAIVAGVAMVILIERRRRRSIQR